MASRDILVLNTTASRAETQQGSDTVIVKNISNEAFRLENSSGTSVLSVNTSGSSGKVTLTGNITASGNVSSSLSSTASFGRLEATTLIGSAFNLTNTALTNTISASSQVANRISGSFRSGFAFNGKISGSAKSTGSFGRIESTTIVGDVSRLTRTDLDGTISSSAQLESRISGAFQSGFGFDGTISGSTPLTASFGRLDALSFHGDGTNLTNTVKTGTLSSSAQIADRISGSFTSGFEFSGTISGSSTSTGSFSHIESNTIVGSAANLTSTTLTGTVSSSAQIAGRISGSFNKGFDFDGTISGIPLSFSAGGAMINGAPSDHFYHRGGAGNKNAGLFFGGGRQSVTTATTEEYDGTSFSEVNDLNNAGQGGGSGTSEAALMTGGYSRGCDTEEYNGTNWSQVNDMNIDTWCYSPIVFGASSEAAVASSGGDSPYTQTETWNGTNWSTANQMINDARFWIGGTGTSNAGLTVGGPFSPSTPQTSKTELWNGTNWSAGPDATYDNMKLTGLAGNQNDAITGGFLQRTNFDGNLFSNPVGNGECSIRYDGSSWSAAGNFGIDGAIAFTGIGQTVGVAMFGAGLSPASPHFYHAPFNTVEVTEGGPTTGSFGRVEVNKLSGDGSQLTNTIPLGSISGSGMIAEQISGSFTKGFNFTGNISGSIISTGSFDKVIVSGKISGDGSGLKGLTGGMISSSAQISDRISGSFNKGFEFDGTIQTSPAAWSVGANMPGNYYGGAGAGRTQNAALHWSGRGPSSNATTNCSQEWNGTTWSGTNDFNKSFRRHSGAGTTESALSVGGYSYPNALESSEYFNGTNWAEKATLPHRGMDGATVGENADILLVGGGDHPGVSSVNVDKYSLSGNAWSQEADAPTNVGGEGAAGTTEAAIIPIFSPSEGSITYDGTSWTEIASTITNRGNGVGIFGTQNNAVAVGGCSNTNVKMGCTEIWNGSSWTYGSSMNNGRGLQNGRTVGTAAAGVAFSTAYGSVNGGAWSCDTELWNEFISTGSFGYVYAESYKGDGSGLTNTSKTGTVSGSGVIASRISGSFQSGFVFNGSLSGSASSTGSFAHVTANTLTGNISNLSNISLPANSLSSSAQLAGVVSASFEQGEYTFEGNLKPTLGAWSSVNGLNTARSSTMGFGNNNAAIAAGGCTANGDYNAWTEKTEQWNGTNWTEVNDMIRHGSRNGRGAGTQDAGLVFGGFQSGYCTEEWNGTIWDTVASMNVERDGLNGYGTQNAAMAVSGYYPNTNGRKDSVETYDGFVWTNTQTMIQTRYGFTGAGSVNASIVSVGRTTFAHGPYGRACNKTELWDGTTWTEVGPNNTSGEWKLGAGTVNAYTMFSGDEGIYTFTSPYTYSDYVTPNSNDKRDYDGITFSEQARLINSMSGRGFNSPNSQTSVMAIGGSTPAGMVNSTEIYTHCQASASFGRIETPKTQITNDSRVVAKESFQLPIFGTNPVTSSAGEVWYNRAEEKLYFTYDINSWSEVADTITAHSFGGYAGGVYQGIVWGGANPNTEDKSEVWSGTTWTEVAVLNTARTYSPGGGDSNAAIAAGGSNPGPTSVTEIWDGTSWTEVNDGALGYGASFAGTVNAAVTTGGRNGSAGAEADTKEWNGANWSTGGSLILARASFAGMLGTQNAAKHMGGTANTFPQQCDDVEDYNGTSFSTAASLSVATKYTSAAGTQNAGVFAGGASDNSSTTSATYEWNGISFHQTANLGTARHTGDIADGSQSSFQVSSGGAYGGSEKKTEQYTTTSVKSMCIGGV